MTPTLTIEPLQVSHLDALSQALLCNEVYQHIEDPLPAHDDFVRGLTIALQGPKPELRLEQQQVWFNYLMRDAATGAMMGRLEATAHDGLAEVAFLLAPTYWGYGHASIGLKWLEKEVSKICNVNQFWATTTPKNFRCQSLLNRKCYVQATAPYPTLLSYDEGDLAFVHDIKRDNQK